MSDADTVTRWEVIRQALVRMRDDRKADPGEIREYAANSALDALNSLESQNQALQERIEELRDIILTVGTPGWYERRNQLLSPTQETDPE